MLAELLERWDAGLTANPTERRMALRLSQQGRRDWRRLLLAIVRELVLAEAPPGDLARELADYLYIRSTGHFASLMTFVTRGCRRTITSGQERLSKDLLDGIRNDGAAEAARRDLRAARDHGLLAAGAEPRPAPRSESFI